VCSFQRDLRRRHQTQRLGLLADGRRHLRQERRIAVALTKMYLGDKAEKRLMEMIKKEPGVQDFDTTTFVLTNKVACDCKTKKCKVSKYEDKVDAAHTKALFGK
jgi:hypothetical protein